MTTQNHAEPIRLQGSDVMGFEGTNEERER